MAGDWIKFQHATLDKPELDQMANILSIDIDSVGFKCLRFWVWADQQSVDGDALSVTEAFIDRLVFAPGFSKALRKVGWLEGRDGKLSIPNFVRHNGETAKKRALSKNRNTAKRKRDAASVTEASPEKRREEKRKSLDRQLGSEALFDVLPLKLRTNRIEEAVEYWAKTRKESNGVLIGLNPIDLKIQLSKLGEPDEETAYVALADASTSGWKTLQLPDKRKSSEKKSASSSKPFSVAELMEKD